MKNAISATKNMKHSLRALGAIGLSILLVISFAACSTPSLDAEAQPTAAAEANTPGGTVVDLQPDRDTSGLDNRTSASETFGGNVLMDIQTQAQQVDASEVLADTPDDAIMSMSELLIAFAAAKADYQEHLSSGLIQAGLNTDGGNMVIDMGPMATADLFTLLAAWEDGPDALLAVWQSGTGGQGWTIDAEELDGTQRALFLLNDIPTVEFVWRWYEADQYLFAVFNTPEYRLEMDVVRTEYGFAGQLYEPMSPATYRFAFTDDGTWNSSIGYCFGITEQPPSLTGMEPITFGGEWPEVEYERVVAIDIYETADATSLVVAQGGGEDGYNIDTGAIAPPDPSPSPDTPPVQTGDNVNYQQVANTINEDVAQTANPSGISEAAVPYSRLWHASPVLGAGWSERFALYEDGSFIWAANQMDGESTCRYFAGTWEIQDGNLLLHSKLVVGWEGGELVENTGIGSFASEQVLLNPTIVVYTLVQEFWVPLGEITHDSGNGRDTVMFNELQLWDFSEAGDSGMEDFWQSFMSTWSRSPEPKTKSLPASGIQ